MKIYTKKGDDGSTGLFGGDRLKKDDVRIEAYGTIDELNSFLGQLCDIDLLVLKKTKTTQKQIRTNTQVLVIYSIISTHA